MAASLNYRSSSPIQMQSIAPKSTAPVFKATPLPQSIAPASPKKITTLGGGGGGSSGKSSQSYFVPTPLPQSIAPVVSVAPTIDSSRFIPSGSGYIDTAAQQSVTSAEAAKRSSVFYVPPKVSTASSIVSGGSVAPISGKTTTAYDKGWELPQSFSPVKSESQEEMQTFGEVGRTFTPSSGYGFSIFGEEESGTSKKTVSSGKESIGLKESVADNRNLTKLAEKADKMIGSIMVSGVEQIPILGKKGVEDYSSGVAENYALRIAEFNNRVAKNEKTSILFGGDNEKALMDERQKLVSTVKMSYPSANIDSLIANPLGDTSITNDRKSIKNILVGAGLRKTESKSFNPDEFKLQIKSTPQFLPDQTAIEYEEERLRKLEVDKLQPTIEAFNKAKDIRAANIDVYNTLLNKNEFEQERINAINNEYSRKLGDYNKLIFEFNSSERYSDNPEDVLKKEQLDAMRLGLLDEQKELEGFSSDNKTSDKLSTMKKSLDLSAAQLDNTITDIQQAQYNLDTSREKLGQKYATDLAIDYWGDEAEKYAKPFSIIPSGNPFKAIPALVTQSAFKVSSMGETMIDFGVVNPYRQVTKYGERNPITAFTSGIYNPKTRFEGESFGENINWRGVEGAALLATFGLGKYAVKVAENPIFKKAAIATIGAIITVPEVIKVAKKQQSAERGFIEVGTSAASLLVLDRLARVFMKTSVIEDRVNSPKFKPNPNMAQPRAFYEESTAVGDSIITVRKTKILNMEGDIVIKQESFVVPKNLFESEGKIGKAQATLEYTSPNGDTVFYRKNKEYDVKAEITRTEDFERGESADIEYTISTKAKGEKTWNTKSGSMNIRDSDSLEELGKKGFAVDDYFELSKGKKAPYEIIQEEKQSISSYEPYMEIENAEKTTPFDYASIKNKYKGYIGTKSGGELVFSEELTSPKISPNTKDKIIFDDEEVYSVGKVSDYFKNIENSIINSKVFKSKKGQLIIPSDSVPMWEPEAISSSDAAVATRVTPKIGEDLVIDARTSPLAPSNSIFAKNVISPYFAFPKANTKIYTPSFSPYVAFTALSVAGSAADTPSYVSYKGITEAGAGSISSALSGSSYDIRQASDIISRATTGGLDTPISGGTSKPKTGTGSSSGSGTTTTPDIITDTGTIIDTPRGGGPPVGDFFKLSGLAIGGGLLGFGGFPESDSVGGRQPRYTRQWTITNPLQDLPRRFFGTNVFRKADTQRFMRLRGGYKVPIKKKTTYDYADEASAKMLGKTFGLNTQRVSKFLGKKAMRF